jgi:hypothetical protein
MHKGSLKMGCIFLVRHVSRSDEKILKLYIFTDIAADVNAAAEPSQELHKIMDSQNINRSHFPPDLSEKEILEILRDISAYISAHDFNPQVQSWVSAQRSLISKLVCKSYETDRITLFV